MEGFEVRIQNLKDELAASAGTDPLYDKYRVGAIAAYTDIINVDVEEVSDED